MALFLYCPSLEGSILYLILFVIFVVSYVAMAWYDYYFDCRVLPLKRGSLSFTGLFKPPPHIKRQITHKETDKDRKKDHYLIYLSHILIIVPILGYVVVYKGKVNNNVYPILATLAIFTLVYHGGALMQHSHKI